MKTSFRKSHATNARYEKLAQVLEHCNETDVRTPMAKHNII